MWNIVYTYKFVISETRKSWTFSSHLYKELSIIRYVLQA